MSKKFLGYFTMSINHGKSHCAHNVATPALLNGQGNSHRNGNDPHIPRSMPSASQESGPYPRKFVDNSTERAKFRGSYSLRRHHTENWRTRCESASSSRFREWREPRNGHRNSSHHPHPIISDHIYRGDIRSTLTYGNGMPRKYYNFSNPFCDMQTRSSTNSPSQRHRHGSASGSSDAHRDDARIDPSRFQLHREWENIETPSPAAASDVKPLRVVSYNILSQKLLHLNSYLYHKCNPDSLRWSNRWEKLQQEFHEFNTDILSLQEVEEYHFHRDIRPFLEKRGYECHYKRRTGRNINKPDGVLIAFRIKRFKLLKCRKVEYNRGSVPPVNQDNVAVITLLKPMAEAPVPKDGCLCVVNTHLLYNPKRGDIKLAQLSTLFAEVSDVLSDYNSDKVSILLCGDFNCIPKSPLYKFVTNRELCYRDLECRHVSGQNVGQREMRNMLPSQLLPESVGISENGCVKVGRDHRWEEEKEFELSHSLGALCSSHCHDKLEASSTQDKGVTVDYIFHTPYRESTDCGIAVYPKRRLSLIKPESLLRVQGLPNFVHPSDHLPIVVDFDLVLMATNGSL